jgi:hypothetical protein
MANIVVPETVRVWKIGVDQGNVLSWNNYTNNQGYHLFCTTNGEFLTYVDINFGFHIGWKAQGDNKTHFRLPDGQEREILSGEPLALGIGGSPSFVKSASRNVGPDLEYVKDPAYEWRIFGADSELGKPIPQNTPVALLNDKVKPAPDFLVFFKREAGADVGWTTSKGWWGQVADFAEKHAVEGAVALIKALA